MERSTRFVYPIFQIARTIFFLSGFVMTKIWIGAVIITSLVVYEVISRCYQRKIDSRVMILIYLGIALWGILGQVPSFLVIAGVSAALACWELEDQVPYSAKQSVPDYEIQYRKNHLMITVITVIAGCILAEAGLLIKMSLPFGINVLVALVVLICLFQLQKLLKGV